MGIWLSELCAFVLLRPLDAALPPTHTVEGSDRCMLRQQVRGKSVLGCTAAATVNLNLSAITLSFVCSRKAAAGWD